MKLQTHTHRHKLMSSSVSNTQKKYLTSRRLLVLTKFQNYNIQKKRGMSFTAKHYWSILMLEILQNSNQTWTDIKIHDLSQCEIDHCKSCMHANSFIKSSIFLKNLQHHFLFYSYYYQAFCNTPSVTLQWDIQVREKLKRKQCTH